jgi:hypothetical protein
MLLSPMTLHTPLLKKLTNQTGATSSVAADTAAVFAFTGADDGDVDALPMMLFDRAEEVGGAERKEDTVMSSM